MELRTKGTEEEQLLFQLLGIATREGNEPCGLLVGVDEPPPEETDRIPYLRLPDPAHPSRETEQLSKLLGRAIGLGEVRL
ncbi:hypothetical protein MD588_22385 [Photobacterium sp. SDRW27]|uniref:hypothetical protein n=1 Tax=Photobacterium obscurum TaxID=2829490 RepID=UPI002243554E|nr:hypothetical protein [Photobacterium obscurum]MCW8331549.1 hypothetical protein [Photobacterium obscurum]